MMALILLLASFSYSKETETTRKISTSEFIQQNNPNSGISLEKDTRTLFYDKETDEFTSIQEPKIPVFKDGMEEKIPEKVSEKTPEKVSEKVLKDEKKVIKEEKVIKKKEKETETGKKDEKVFKKEENQTKEDKRPKKATEELHDFNFKDFLSQYGGIEGLMSEIINNEKFQQIALMIKKYPFIKNVFKLMFDLGLGGMRQQGCTKCSKGTRGGDSFESRRFEKGKTNLKKEDFEKLLLILDKLKNAILKDKVLHDFLDRLERDPWNTAQLIFDPSILKRLFDAMELDKYYGKDKYTGMKRTFNGIMKELDL